MTMKNTIKDLIGAYSRLDPPIIPDLNPAATKTDINKAQRALDVKFPDELVDFLSIHNGQRNPGRSPNWALPGLIYHDGDASSYGIGRSSKAWLNDLKSMVQFTEYDRSNYDEYGFTDDDHNYPTYGPAKYHRNFIAITRTEGADKLMMDLEPTKGGHFGQIVMVATQPFIVSVIANSLADLFQRVITSVEENRLKYEADINSWHELKNPRD
ncbi:MAG: SMI1/KNR4 family protein [Planctomycetota bacterium]